MNIVGVPTEYSTVPVFAEQLGVSATRDDTAWSRIRRHPMSYYSPSAICRWPLAAPHYPRT